MHVDEEINADYLRQLQWIFLNTGKTFRLSRQRYHLNGLLSFHSVGRVQTKQRTTSYGVTAMPTYNFLILTYP